MPRRFSFTEAAIAALAALIVSIARPAAGAITMPHLFTDHCVLQRNAAIPVWGWAAPGKRISVRFAGQRVWATTDRRGKWLVHLAPLQTDAIGRRMVISGDGRKVIRDILVGDVWLCSGQSNMQFPLDGHWARALHARREVAAAGYPLIRLLKVPRTNTPEPQRDMDASWMVCSPATAKDFSAVAYFFGRDLFQRIHVPIGLIDSSYGGTVIQSWTPMSALRRTPALHGDVAWFKVAKRRYKLQLAHYRQVMKAWTEATRQARAKGKSAPARPRIGPPRNPFTLSRPSPDMAPVSIFNSMIHPLIPFAIRGVIWCQGENNAWVNDRLYPIRLQAMIKGWRRNWAAPQWPFLIVQIAPYFHYPNPTIGVPLVWEGEEQAVKTLPAVGMVGTMDIGNLHNIHFRNKQAVGRRLATLAREMVYQHAPMRTLGPMYSSMRLDANKIVIRFSDASAGLASRNGKPLDWFEIAGKNRKFVPANARIQGKHVVVWARAVPHPVAARFGWSCKAQPNLMDKTGMPVLPFRTDNWPLK